MLILSLSRRGMFRIRRVYADVTPGSKKAVARAVLERKYKGVRSSDYVNMVLKSFQDDPVQPRGPRYVKKAPLPSNRLCALMNVFCW